MTTYRVEIKRGGCFYWSVVKFKGTVVVSFSFKRTKALQTLAKVIIEHHNPKRAFILKSANLKYEVSKADKNARTRKAKR